MPGSREPCEPIEDRVSIYQDPSASFVAAKLLTASGKDVFPNRETAIQPLGAQHQSGQMTRMVLSWFQIHAGHPGSCAPSSFPTWTGKLECN